MKKIITAIFLLLCSFHVFADRYGIYDDDYISSGDNPLNKILGFLIICVAIFFGGLKLLSIILDFTSNLLNKIKYNSQCNEVRKDIKLKIQNLISAEVEQNTKNSKHIKTCYIATGMVLHFIFLLNDFYSNDPTTSLLLLIFYTSIIGVFIHFFYLFFLRLKSHFVASKKYKQFKNLPQNYDELRKVKQIVDSF